MNYIQRGFDVSIKSVKKHWVVFILLILIQISFIVTAVFSGLHYHSVLFEDLQNVVVPMQQIEYSPEIVQTGEFTQILEVYKSFNSLKDNAYRFLVQSALLFLVFNCILWVGIHVMRSEKIKNFLSDRKKILDRVAQFVASSTVGLLVMYVIGYFFIIQTFAISTDESLFGNVLKVLLVLMGIIYYFLAVGYAFVGSSWKQTSASYYNIGIKKIFQTLAVAVINALIIFVFLYVVYYSMTAEQLFWLVLPSSLLVSAVLVLAKLFWVNCLRELVK